ncbi:MAG: hypothetical protein Q9227_002213 [Pyrenula ochraceoflavens]
MPNSWAEHPFALFVTSPISYSTINHALSASHEGSSVGGTSKMWLFHLMSSTSYSALPREHIRSGNYTSAPIPIGFQSPFVGAKSREEGIVKAAEWLEKAPENGAVDRKHFAVLDEESELQGEGSVVVARIGDDELEGKEVHWMEIRAYEAGLFLKGLEYGAWEERAEDKSSGVEEHVIKR